MSEAQSILHWIKSEGYSYAKVGRAIGLTRESVSRIAHGRGDCTGATVLSKLRQLAINLEMPAYQKSAKPTPQQAKPLPAKPTPQQAKPLPAKPTPQQAKPLPAKPMPRLPIYRVGVTFNCHKCKFPNKARTTQSYCVRCEQPYLTK